jgi:prevent-host-death family protein
MAAVSDHLNAQTSLLPVAAQSRHLLHNGATMVSVGSKQLRRHLGAYLQLAREGSAVQITDRGRPVACLIPAQSRKASEEADRLARLVARGAVRLGSGRFFRGKPAKLKPGPSIVEMLAEERR